MKHHFSYFSICFVAYGGKVKFRFGYCHDIYILIQIINYLQDLSLAVARVDAGALNSIPKTECSTIQGWMLKAPPVNPRAYISRYPNLDPREGHQQVQKNFEKVLK